MMRTAVLRDPVAVGIGQFGRLIVFAMNYKDIEYVVRARPGRDQWTFVISYPRSVNPTEVHFSGSRDEAIAELHPLPLARATA
jgi:hypothetical protein